MQFDHAILNGTIVTGNRTFPGNIYVKDERIFAITSGTLEGDVREVTDASGMVVLPGLIDSHVHSRDGLRGALHKEDFSHASAAAVCGGVTTIVEMPNTDPPTCNAENLRSLRDCMAPKARCDFGLWGMCLGKLNNAELPKMAAEGVTAFKYFWGYALNLENYALIYNYKPEMKNVLPPLDDGEVLTIFQKAAETGLPLAIHAENFYLIRQLSEKYAGDPSYEAVLRVRPAVVETTVIRTALDLARATGARLHILHVGCGEAVEIIRQAQREGLSVTAETCPHYLFLSDEDFPRAGSLLKTYPIVRTKGDQKLLWEGLRDGTLSMVVTDHAPHTPDEKLRPYADALAGIVGVETCPSLMLTAVNEGKITLNQLASLCSENAAKLLGLFPRKGNLCPGADADLTIADMNARWTFHQGSLHSRTKLSPYDGWEMKGRVVKTILRGKTVAENGEPVGEPSGKFLSPVKRS